MTPGGNAGDPERPPAGPAPTQASGPGGLCPGCRHVKRLVNDRGSTFYLCQLARVDPGLPRYPVQPRLVCRGYER